MWRILTAMVMGVAINLKWGECIDRQVIGGVFDLDGIAKTDGDPNLVVQVRELFSLCSNLACSSILYPRLMFFTSRTGPLEVCCHNTLITTF